MTQYAWTARTEIRPNDIVIHRGNPKYFERGVRITQDRKSWVINPPADIQNATGQGGDGTWCIVAFAAGVTHANHHVIISDNGFVHEFYMPEQVVPVYYLLGLAWARGEWTDTVLRLQTTVMPGQRRNVLEHTGRYYLQHPEARRASGKLQLMF